MLYIWCACYAERPGDTRQTPARQVPALADADITTPFTSHLLPSERRNIYPTGGLSAQEEVVILCKIGLNLSGGNVIPRLGGYVHMTHRFLFSLRAQIYVMSCSTVHPLSYCAVKIPINTTAMQYDARQTDSTIAPPKNSGFLRRTFHGCSTRGRMLWNKYLATFS